MPANLDVCACCGHIRQYHDQRFIPGRPACPLPCECVAFAEPKHLTQAQSTGHQPIRIREER